MFDRTVEEPFGPDAKAYMRLWIPMNENIFSFPVRVACTPVDEFLHHFNMRADESERARNNFRRPLANVMSGPVHIATYALHST